MQIPHGITSREWYNIFSRITPHLGFKQCTTYHSVFTNGTDNYFIALLISVNAIILEDLDFKIINSVRSKLQHVFKIKDLGPLRFFLEFEIA